jgi:hypothetical protein
MRLSASAPRLSKHKQAAIHRLPWPRTVGLLADTPFERTILRKLALTRAVDEANAFTVMVPSCHWVKRHIQTLMAVV